MNVAFNGGWYMICGGKKNANIVRLRDDFSGAQPLADRNVPKEITTAPECVEDPLMFKRGGRYCLMWSTAG